VIGEFYRLLDEETVEQCTRSMEAAIRRDRAREINPYEIEEEPVSIFNKEVYEQYLEKVKNGGVKHDAGKPRMALLPPKALRHVAEVMTFGADKYGEHNYLGGMDHLRLLDAMLRHINSHISGQDRDEETGKYHIAHAAACTLMLLEYLINDLGSDNRWEGYKR